MDRKFKSVDKLHAWVDEITITIGFHLSHTSYKQKKNHFTVSLYLRYYQYGRFRG